MKVLDRTADSLRLASLSSWRTKERGLAIVAGVFLASLVVTTVLAYGNGLSQAFLAGGIEADVIDAKVDMKRPPGDNVTGRTNDSAQWASVCDDLLEDESLSVKDCDLVYGRQGVRVTGFFDQNFIRPQPLNVESVTGSMTDWSNVSFDYPDQLESGPPINGQRSVRLLGDGSWDGEFADRYAEQILYGEWPTPEQAAEQRAVVLPNQVASQAGASANDTLDELVFSYVSDFTQLPTEIDPETCQGVVNTGVNGFQYCRQTITLQNLTIAGVYEVRPPANPALQFNHIFIASSILTAEQNFTLMENDHAYLALAIDRGKLPSSSTSAAADWLDEIENSVEARNYTSAEIEVDYYDLISGTLTFLNIYLGFVQVFDYIIMIPIIALSLSVLAYGMLLSLEQRRREISIERVIGATSETLQRMVLVEILVMSSVAWFVGYLLALATVPLILSAVGFMEFDKPEQLDVSVTLSLFSTIILFALVVGIAAQFGRSRTRSFLEMEIDEGVKKVVVKEGGRRWLQNLVFFIGLIALVESYIEAKDFAWDVDDDGLISNFIFNGLLFIFGPFLLWIGGALVLGRLGALGPKIAQLMFGRTPLLKDVRRGLRRSGSAESVNRLAIIMILTLSIVTLAAVQGETGTQVDERTASAQVGADLQVKYTDSVNESVAEQRLRDALIEIGEDPDASFGLTTVPTILTNVEGKASNIPTWVLMDHSKDVLRWDDQAVPNKDRSAAFDGWKSNMFSAGETAATTLDLTREVGRGDTATNEEDTTLELIHNQIDFVLIPADQQEDPLTALGQAIEDLGLSPNYSGKNLSASETWAGFDFSGSNMLDINLSGSDLTNASLAGAAIGNGLSDVQPNLTGLDLTGANLSGAGILDIEQLNPFSTSNLLDGVNFTDANLSGAWGFFDLNSSILDNTTCPDGTNSDQTGCASGPASIFTWPTEVALAFQPLDFAIETTTRNTTVDFIGEHQWIPGLDAAEALNSIIIGESTWRQLVGEDTANNLTATTWFYNVGTLASKDDGEVLRRLNSQLTTFKNTSTVQDWSTAHEEVERNGGLIYGTPGLLTLQFVVASLAAVASAFVFLTLVLTQRRKELAILQAIGASPNQVMRLVLFEILSIVIFSMVLGSMLGVGISYAFNGFFDIFGFIFQLFGGNSTPIDRDLLFPWFRLTVVYVIVLATVITALLLTTRQALKADLAVTLKGE